jgi:choline dehydrogenase-like flavoprotein
VTGSGFPWHGCSGDSSRVRALVAAELARAGAGEVISRDASSLDPKQHHHAGTTRMHLDPALGVVDENLRVHGMENLYVAGSSVFPTAGVANPTLTVVALALRLAAHLAGSPPDCFAAPGRSQ